MMMMIKLMHVSQYAKIYNLWAKLCYIIMIIKIIIKGARSRYF